MPDSLRARAAHQCTNVAGTTLREVGSECPGHAPIWQRGTAVAPGVAPRGERADDPGGVGCGTSSHGTE
eukprot:5751975-Prymnesium_polylepis.1